MSLYNDLSTVLTPYANKIKRNESDIEAVGDEITNLKDDISKIDGISEEVKQTLLNCFSHVAWDDADGQKYYDALYSALYGGGDWTWKYTPDDGLLSAQSYMNFSTNATGWSEEIIGNVLRLFVPMRTDGGGASWRVTYDFGVTQNGGSLKGLIKTNGLAHTYGPTIMGARLQLSNGSSGARCAFNAYVQNGTRYLEVNYQEGTEIKSVRTTLLADEYHEVELIMDGNNQIIYVDGSLIATSAILSTVATVSSVAVQATNEQVASDGVYLDIKNLIYKEF